MSEEMQLTLNGEEIRRIIWALTEQKKYYITLISLSNERSHDFINTKGKIHENDLLIEKITGQRSEQRLAKNTPPYLFMVWDRALELACSDIQDLCPAVDYYHLAGMSVKEMADTFLAEANAERKDGKK